MDDINSDSCVQISHMAPLCWNIKLILKGQDTGIVQALPFQYKHGSWGFINWSSSCSALKSIVAQVFF